MGITDSVVTETQSNRTALILSASIEHMYILFSRTEAAELDKLLLAFLFSAEKYNSLHP